MTSATVDQLPSSRHTACSGSNPPAIGSGVAVVPPRDTRAVGTTSRTCWNDQRLAGAFCQVASDQRSAGRGGKPIMVMGVLTPGRSGSGGTGRAVPSLLQRVEREHVEGTQREPDHLAVAGVGG